MTCQKAHKELSRVTNMKYIVMLFQFYKFPESLGQNGLNIRKKVAKSKERNVLKHSKNFIIQ